MQKKQSGTDQPTNQPTDRPTQWLIGRVVRDKNAQTHKTIASLHESSPSELYRIALCVLVPVKLKKEENDIKDKRIINEDLFQY